MKKDYSIIKFTRLFFVIAALALTVMLCASCKQKGLDIVVFDYETNERLSTINSIEDEERFIKLNEIIFDSENYRNDLQYILSEDNSYSILLEDPKDSTYDIWYKVVFENDQVFIKYDFDKMDEEYSKTLKEMDTPVDYYECAVEKADDFKLLLFGE